MKMIDILTKHEMIDSQRDRVIAHILILLSVFVVTLSIGFIVLSKGTIDIIRNHETRIQQLEKGKMQP